VSVGAPVERVSGAPPGVGVRTVGLSSAMSPTVYGRGPRGPSAKGGRDAACDRFRGPNV
jgi:hypothetical protein